MTCTICASHMRPIVSDLPTKISEQTTVILKGLPVLQCDNCSRYLIEDSVLDRAGQIFSGVGETAKLEIIRYTT